MSAQAIVCTNCGAGLEPKALETKVKCNYCMTVFVIVRDHEGVRDLAAEGAAAPAASPGSAPAGSLPAGSPPVPADPIAAMTGMDPQTVARIERDAMAVVGGLMAQEARQVARGGSCVVIGFLFLVSAFAVTECALRVFHG